MKLDAYSGRDAQMIRSFFMQCESSGISDVSAAGRMLENLIVEKAIKHKMSPEERETSMIKQADRRARIIARKKTQTSVMDGERCPKCGSGRWVTGLDKQQEVVWTECKKCSFSMLREG